MSDIDVKALTHTFEFFDKDKDGKITPAELKNAMVSLGSYPFSLFSRPLLHIF